MGYRITGQFCGYLISAVFCGQLRTAEFKIAEYYVKYILMSRNNKSVQITWVIRCHDMKNKNRP